MLPLWRKYDGKYKNDLETINPPGSIAYCPRHGGTGTTGSYVVERGTCHCMAYYLQRCHSVHPCVPVKGGWDHSVEGCGGASLSGRGRVFGISSFTGRRGSHVNACCLLRCRRRDGSGGLLPRPSSTWSRLDFLRWCYHAAPGSVGLAALAVRIPVGYRSSGRHQYDFNGCDPADDWAGGATKTDSRTAFRDEKGSIVARNR